MSATCSLPRLSISQSNIFALLVVVAAAAAAAASTTIGIGAGGGWAPPRLSLRANAQLARRTSKITNQARRRSWPLARSYRLHNCAEYACVLCVRARDIMLS